MSRWNEFEEFVEEIMESENIPGVAVALSRDGNIIYKKGFGKRNLETGETVTPETLFGIASITKSFTAFALMKLAEEGKLQIEDPVSKYLPNFCLRGCDHLDDIKIHHLLSHTTGLGTMKRIEKIDGFEDHLSYLNETEQTYLGMPGEYFCYNNDLFLLLGAIIEKVTGENYQDYIRQYIITPLKMDRTTYNLKDLARYDNVTTPYVLENNEPKACEWPTLGNYAVGGGIRSTVMDLLMYGETYVGGPEKRIIEERSIEKMTESVHWTSGKSFYGYGLKRTPAYSGVTLVEHGGGQPGVSSNFGFIPEQGIVAAVLTNMSGVSADAIWLAMVNAALDLPIDRKRSLEPSFKMDKGQFDRFIGTYRSGEGAEVVIASYDQTLTATIMGKTFNLRASDESTLVILETEKPIRFFFEGDNGAWALFLGLRMLVKSPVIEDCHELKTLD